MLNILILASLLLISCATTPFPSAPDIHDQYVIEVEGEGLSEQFLSTVTNPEDITPMHQAQVARCLHFNIVSVIPYEIEYDTVVPLKTCNMVGGFVPKDVKKIANFLVDAKQYAETHKKCFR